MFATVKLCCQLVIAMLAAIMVTEGQEKLTNIDYLGFGYNVITANPHSNLFDPGFLEPVIQLRYDNKSVSADGKWLIPDGTSVRQIPACSYIAESIDIHGTSSYRDALSVDARIEGGTFGFEFSASTEYKNVRAGTSNERKTFVNSEARCMVYNARIRGNARIEVTSDFAYAVSSLPTTVHSSNSADQSYERFIKTYGTHYVGKVEMGAKAILRHEFEQHAWSSFQQTGLAIKAAASASFRLFNFGASAATAQETEAARSFESKRISKKEFYIGGKPNGDFEKWAKNAGNKPSPIQYDLIPLTDLLDPRYFPDIDPLILKTKRRLLNTSIVSYCHSLPECGVAKPDPIPVMMDRVQMSIRGNQQVSCKPGYSLLSCGIDNMPNTKWEVYRMAFPTSSNTCHCYDYFGAVCVAWCTDAVKGFEIAVSPRVAQRSGNVFCSPGKKVIGCHIQPLDNNNKHELWRSHYPLPDGNGCLCYDYFGAKCHATCASNIKNHYVVSQYAKGVATARCPERNYVLGCGIHTHSPEGEKWRTVHIAPSMDACQCYDFFGATCYAICGIFDN